MPFFTVHDGTRLFYEVSGEGEPLLLVSGQGSDHSFWNQLRTDLTDRYRVIVYDNRGTGQSDKPSSPPYSTRGFAHDAIQLLDHLGIEQAHAYGISMGGRICQWLGIDHGERIGSLVLSATTPGSAHGVPTSTEVEDVFSKALTNTKETKNIMQKMLPYFYSLTWIKSHADVARELFKNLPIPEYARKLHFQASKEHDAWELLPAITIPTLVIHGDEDQMNPTANAYLLAERIPNSELSIIKGGRHGYFLEFRKEVSSVINDFLLRHPLDSNN